MSLSIKVRLLSILPKLMLIGMRGLEDVLKEFPEATTRSMLLRLFDDRGGEMCIWLGFENEQPAAREVECRNPPFATTEVSMHIDVFLRVLKGKLDFRSAYLYDLIDIRSNDGLPASYHLILWSAFWDRVRKLLE